MQNPPSVYIVMLAWNGRDYTLDAVESVLRSDYPNFRLVVVDNASTDGTPQAIRAKYPDTRVHLIENPENLLYAGGNNVGIRWAMDQGADYVCLINNDVLVEPTMLSRLVGAAVERGAGVAGPMIYYHRPGRTGPELIWFAGGIVELWRGLAAHRGIREPDSGQYAEAGETGYVTGCCMLISRACIERVGMLDTAYTLYSEDSDFCMRAALAGFKLLFVPDARMWHKVSLSSGGEFAFRKQKRKLASNIRFFVRYARPWHYVTAPVFALGRTFSFIVRRLAAGRPA